MIISSYTIGQKVPDFELPDQRGHLFQLSKALKQGPVVLYFFPRDNTPGCTREACSFRDQFPDFERMGATVAGISSDSVSRHQEFAHRLGLPFPLLSDTENRIRELFGVPSGFLGLFPGRVTYILDQEGVIRHIFNSQLRINQHISEALASLQQFQSPIAYASHLISPKP
jgi:peroxiredoxin Q/BCP